MTRTFAVAIGLSAVCLLGIGAAALAPLKVQKEKENVVASILIGTWVPDKPLTERLGGRSVVVEGGGQAGATVVSTDDAKVAGMIPPMYNEFLADKQVYLSGTMSIGADKYPYILISQWGNPYVVFFRPRDGKPMGDAESFNVMAATAKDNANDLLLIGGDFNNQPFSAYKRAKEAE